MESSISRTPGLAEPDGEGSPAPSRSHSPLAQRGLAHLDHADDLFDGSPEVVHPGCHQKCWEEDGGVSSRMHHAL